MITTLDLPEDLINEASNNHSGGFVRLLTSLRIARPNGP